MEKPTPLAADSREARLAYEACSNLSCEKSRKDSKMFTCKGCRVILYCSRECQRAHWPLHKAHCKYIQQEHAAIEEGGIEAKLKALSLGQPQPLLPSQVGEEFRDFVKHFGPHIHITALNMFRAGPNDPRIVEWDEGVLLVKFQRRKNFPPNAPPWARFYLEQGARASYEDLEAVVGDYPEYANFKSQKPILFEEARRRGPGHGCLVTWMICASEVAALQAPFPQMFSPAAAASDRLPPMVDSVAYLKAQIDRQSKQAFK